MNPQEPETAAASSVQAVSPSPPDDIVRAAAQRQHLPHPGDTSETTTDFPSLANSLHRLHPATVWLPLCEAMVGAILPTVVVGTFIGFARAALGLSLFVLLPTAIYNVVRFVTLRYRLDASELIITSGLVSRRERRIALERVQDTEIHQGPVYRAFDLAKLEVTTAGSEAQEAVLDTLSRHSAELLQNAIAAFQEKAGASETSRDAAQRPSELLCQLLLRDLVMGGLTSRLVASLFAIIGALLYFKGFITLGGLPFGDIEQQITNRALRHLPDRGPIGSVVDFFFADTLGKSLFFILGGFFVSIAGYTIRYHGYRLTRTGDVLSKSHGLFSFRTSSLPQKRIQALKIEEGLLRRWFNLAAIRVDSGGDRNELDDSKKRDALVPVTSKAKASWLTLQVIPGLVDVEPLWKQVSRLAVMRGSKKGWALLFLATLQTYLVVGWFCLIWLPAIPLVYFLNYKWYRNTGYSLERDYFISRKGWLNRATLFLPIKNIQNVTVSRNYFDRRLGLATLSIDTAGQSNTGGGPVIRNLPADEAWSLQRLLTNPRTT